MNTTSPHSLPDPQTCEQARLSRDLRFDGLFVVAVTSTKVFCRPMCPAPTPKPINVKYFRNAAEAVTQGFRPCLRCRPELAPLRHVWHRSDALAHRALALVDQHDPAADSVASLALHLGTSARHLHRLFSQQFGAAPITFIATRRLLFAKQLLSETDLPIGDIAYASGFGSVRRFNDAILAHFRLTPSMIRKRTKQNEADVRDTRAICLQMPFRPPYAFAAQLAFFAKRALPGLERVVDNGYERVVRTRSGVGRLRVELAKQGHALKLHLFNIDARDLAEVYARVRRMFDLDAEPSVIASVLSKDPQLKSIVKQEPGLRIPGAYDGFEIGVRAILGQQVSVAGARTLALRLLKQFGEPVLQGVDGQPANFFPSAARLAEVELQAIGMPGARAKAIQNFARAVRDFDITFRIDQALDQFVAQVAALPGLGPWTAHYIAARALGHPDAFPAGDLILRKIFANNDDALRERELETQSQTWRPWRAYAMFYAWHKSNLQE